jgi:hypothetical protein
MAREMHVTWDWSNQEGEEVFYSRISNKVTKCLHIILVQFCPRMCHKASPRHTP